MKERRKEGRQEHINVDEEQRVREIEGEGGAEKHSQCAVYNVPEKKYYGCYNSRTLHRRSTYSLRRCLVSAAVWIWLFGLDAQLANCKLEATRQKLIRAWRRSGKVVPKM